MMIAMWRGMLPRRSSSSGVRLLVDNGPPGGVPARPRGSDLHDLGGLLLEQLVHERDVAIGQLLHVRDEALRVVLRNRPLVLLVLHVLVDVVAHLTHVHATLLGEL